MGVNREIDGKGMPVYIGWNKCAEIVQKDAKRLSSIRGLIRAAFELAGIKLPMANGQNLLSAREEVFDKLHEALWRSKGDMLSWEPNMRVRKNEHCAVEESFSVSFFHTESSMNREYAFLAIAVNEFSTLPSGEAAIDLLILSGTAGENTDQLYNGDIPLSRCGSRKNRLVTLLGSMSESSTLRMDDIETSFSEILDMSRMPGSSESIYLKGYFEIYGCRECPKDGSGRAMRFNGFFVRRVVYGSPLLLWRTDGGVLK